MPILIVGYRPTASAREVCEAWHNFQHALHEVRQQRVQGAGTSIEDLMEAGRVKEEWDHLARWYRKVGVKHAHPTREGLEQESADRA